MKQKNGKTNNNPSPQETAVHPVFSALQKIAAYLGVPAPEAVFSAFAGETLTVAKAVRAFDLRARPVQLQGDWWKEDGGVFLGFRSGSGMPVALIPDSPGRYRAFDAEQASGARVDGALAARLDRYAYALYAPFGAGEVGLRQIVRFSLKRFWRRDLVFALAAGAVGGILELAVPFLTGIMFDFVVPARQTNQLLWIVLLLALSGFTAFVFQLARSFSLMRIEAELDSGLESALWDRMLNLPVEFFREYSAGDLANRASGVTKIRKSVSETVVTVALTCLFSLFSLLFLFTVSAPAGFAVLLCTLALALATALFFHGMKQPVMEKSMESGRLEGLLIQLIRGYHKFVVTGSRQAAYALWRRPFLEVKRMEAGINKKSAKLDVLTAVFPVAAAVAFYAAAYYGQPALSTGNYLALYAAFSTVLISVGELSQTVMKLLTVFPYYERMKPMLECRPEVDACKANPGKLKGEISFSHVSFRYPGGGKNAVDDVSFTVRPGEMAALVGGSGSGKSTLLKLLLGFETPKSGMVCYDGTDLAALDVQEVRSQIGTVIQNAQIMSESIYRNIAGSANISIEDAWAAAKLVGLDRDIEEMPMGMHTFLNEGGRTLSGGQRQKILLARALVKNPGILFLDEATSALDNTAQLCVTESMSRLKMTRVVIAHRLSTVMNADMIYVLEGGRIVQQGSYEQLMASPGPFREFARRQIVQ